MADAPAERAPTYWLNLFSVKTWQEFLAAGAHATGFRAARWATVRQVQPGDLFLCYLTGLSRFVGILEATGSAYKSDTPIWPDELFPCRIDVRLLVSLTPETAVPIVSLRDELSFFRETDRPFAWTGHVRGSPTKYPAADGAAIARAIMEAERNPIVRPVDPGKAGKRPRAIPSAIGPVTLPEPEDIPDVPASAEVREATEHTEIQWLLLKFGNDMGLDVWVARNDRNRAYDGHRFAALPRMLDMLPVQFAEPTKRIIELIDVLWLRDEAIVAAFEIESTTSIYSGLLRMSDLVAMQPNIKLPLYLVAPGERRGKVIQEVNRPTFSRLRPPLREVCRFLAFDELRREIAQLTPYAQHVSPSVLDTWSEACDPEDAA